MPQPEIAEKSGLTIFFGSSWLTKKCRLLQESSWQEHHRKEQHFNTYKRPNANWHQEPKYGNKQEESILI